MIPTATAISHGAPNVEVYFAYDYASRRIGKSVVDKRSTPNGRKHISYAYDQWNPVAVWERPDFSSTPVLKHTHLWGLDIGSSGKVHAATPAGFQQAGGIAGLIASTYHNNTGTRDSLLPSYDANGNIIAWTTGDGTLLRKIDYDAFGNEVMVEDFGSAIQTNKLPEFGFSTKIKDAETGLSYYGYRYYDPITGRWPSRDPIEEEGGGNLYGFVGNDGISGRDFLGLKKQIISLIYGPDTKLKVGTTDSGFGNPRKTYGQSLGLPSGIELYTGDHEFIKEKTAQDFLDTYLKEWERNAEKLCCHSFKANVKQSSKGDPMTVAKAKALIEELQKTSDQTILIAHGAANAFAKGETGLIFYQGEANGRNISRSFSISELVSNEIDELKILACHDKGLPKSVGGTLIYKMGNNTSGVNRGHTMWIKLKNYITNQCNACNN